MVVMGGGGGGGSGASSRGMRKIRIETRIY
jgi:hypothetical protein